MSNFQPDLSETIEELEKNFPESKVCALAAHLNVSSKEILNTKVQFPLKSLYRYRDQEFLILTDEEADVAAEDPMNQWIEEQVFSQIPDDFRHYCHFDDEGWKEEAYIDGRGHYLASYDGWEREQGSYFIYRLA